MDSKTVCEARILVVGDLHFSKRSITILDKLTVKLIEEIERLKPHHVIFLGDTLDRFGTVDTPRVKEAIDFLAKATVLSQVTLLIGNHDIPNKTCFMSRDHGFVGLKYYWPITVVDDKCVEFSVNGIIFQAVPYCPNGRLAEGLDTLPDRAENPAAIFAHQEILGCDIDGNDSKGGDKWNINNPLLISGHIHKYHQPQINVLYTGSPYQDSFGENTDKSISLITFRSSESKITWTEKRIRLGMPEKHKLVMSTKEYKSWELSSNRIYWIKVSGTARLNSQCRTLEKTRYIDGSGGRVIFTDTDRFEDNGSGHKLIDGMTLRETVSTSIQNKPYLHNIYAKVFI